MQLKVKKLHPEAILPCYAREGDAGLDLYSVAEVLIKPQARALIPTGIAVELPTCTEAQVRPRSGLALKYGVTVLNTPGTIDEGYRGEVGVILINLGNQDFVVQIGMKIAQMVVSPRVHVTVAEVESLSDTQRGEGGFGSTGHTSQEQLFVVERGERS